MPSGRYLLEEKSCQCIACTILNRPLYQYKEMPFGLCNAVQTLCRLMHQVVPPSLRTRVFVYLDDLLLLSDDFDLHMQLIEEVAGSFRKAKLKMNIAKSKFCLKKIRYLGFIIGDGQLKVDPDRISALKVFPKPITTKQLRRFLGLAGWWKTTHPSPEL